MQRLFQAVSSEIAGLWHRGPATRMLIILLSAVLLLCPPCSLCAFVPMAARVARQATATASAPAQGPATATPTGPETLSP